MSTAIKSSTSWFLVISSMVALTAFVGYWNYSSYSTEKKKLVEDVQIQLQLAYTETKDSELILFIKTHLEDNEEFRFFTDSASLQYDKSLIFPELLSDTSSENQPFLVREKLARDTTIILDFEFLETKESPSIEDISPSEVTVVAATKNSTVVFDHTINQSDSFPNRIKPKSINIVGSPNGARINYSIHGDSNMIKSWNACRDSNNRITFNEADCDLSAHSHGPQGRWHMASTS